MLEPSKGLAPAPSTRTSEEENQIFAAMRKKYGDVELENKIQRLESTRRYYRRFPYDAWAKRTGLDAVDLTMPGDPLQEIMAAETRSELLDGLTERELWVAERAEEGYKPRDMAAMRGKATSNADRWIKHSVKAKMEAKLQAGPADL